MPSTLQSHGILECLQKGTQGRMSGQGGRRKMLKGGVEDVCKTVPSQHDDLLDKFFRLSVTRFGKRQLDIKS